jgi:hypothetical protein
VRAVLDISVVLAPAVPHLEDEEVAISVVTLAELHFGVLVTADPRAERLRRLAVLDARSPHCPSTTGWRAATGSWRPPSRRPGGSRAPGSGTCSSRRRRTHTARGSTPRTSTTCRGLEDLVDVVAA